MKTDLRINEFAEKIAADQKLKLDFIASTSALSLVSKDGHLQLSVINDGQAETFFKINDHAHRQLAAHLDIPMKYYKKMRASEPDLLVHNANLWLNRSNTRRMVRTMDGTVRAILSDRYNRIEHEQIAEVVLPILSKTPGLRFESLSITSSKMYIKAVTDKVTLDVGIGDMVQAGVVISNSEIGAGAVSIQPMIFRLVCDNGLILSDNAFRAAHIGRRIGNANKIIHMLSDEAIRAEDDAILLAIRDVMKSAIDEVVFSEAVQNMRDSKKDLMSGDIPKTISLLASKFALSDGEGNGILRHLIAGGDVSRYGLLNAVTRYSQDVDNYDRATDLELVGGKLLDLDRSQWNSLQAV